MEGTTMGRANFIGRVGALAVALGVGIAVAKAPAVAFAEPDEFGHDCQSLNSYEPDRTALIMGWTSLPTPDDA